MLSFVINNEKQNRNKIIPGPPWVWSAKLVLQITKVTLALDTNVSISSDLEETKIMCRDPLLSKR